VSDPDWPFRAGDAAVFKALASGAHAASLRAYFGAVNYAELARLATARRRKLRRGAQVLILPGIMGSKLGTASQRRKSDQMVWFDPATIGAGGLIDLALPEGRRLGPRGVQLFGYARLLLELRQQGFDATLHSYDWRLGLEELGQLLAARIAASDQPVILVGHSMGGLVARMAIALLPKRKVRKLILLGTPNFGSFAAVQALRGTYAFVRKVSRLDPAHSPQFLARHVFHTFPGLYHLLPAGGAPDIPDMCQASRWPATGLQPDAGRLAQVAAVRAGLAAPDERMVQIAGVNQPTVVAVRRKPGGFLYHMGWHGDGTVPLTMALLPKLRTYYVRELHARLPGNSAVIRAVIEIIRSGSACALPRRWRSRVESLPSTDDATLQKTGRGKIDWLALDAATREAVMADLNS
jgi:pimeloyl-ACP methyl ester carboxylesterase